MTKLLWCSHNANTTHMCIYENHSTHTRGYTRACATRKYKSLHMWSLLIWTSFHADSPLLYPQVVKQIISFYVSLLLGELFAWWFLHMKSKYHSMLLLQTHFALKYQSAKCKALFRDFLCTAQAHSQSEFITSSSLWCRSQNICFVNMDIRWLWTLDSGKQRAYSPG